MDEPNFTDLLDDYLKTKSDYEYLDHPNCDDMSNEQRKAVTITHELARNVLNNYMLFMRRRVHSHSDMFMPDGPWGGEHGT